MKKFVIITTFITVWVIGIAFYILINSYTESEANKNRYEVFANGMSPTILLDKKSGEAWRNVKCGEKEPPNCWERMER